ncbi:TPA: hypothetical protein ACHLBH_004982, partial [Escherichia coli]
MSDRRSSQQKTGDHLSELRSYLYAHPEKLKSLTSRQRYNLDNNIATSDLLEMYTRLSGQRSDRLNALTATLSDDLAAALSAPSQAISQQGSISGEQQPRGIRNNNPGNLRAARNASGSDGAFVTFNSPGDGVSALARQLRLYGARGVNTVEGIIGMYAPPTENGTAAYIRSVSEMTGFSADQKLDLDDPSVLAKLIPAIIRHENGVQPYSPDLILKSVNDAMSDPRWGARELSMKSNIITPQS